MYQVYCDDTLIYDLRDDALILLEPKVSLEVNKAGSFEFKFPPNHPAYDLPVKMKSLIRVLQDGVEIFAGRPTSQKVDFYNRKYIYCEGQLAYLNDSIQRPAEYHNMSIRGYLESLVACHNEQVDSSKQFEVGIVTVYDANNNLYRYTNYETTMKEIKEDLVDDYGGFLRVRNHEGHRYLDYLADFDSTAQQIIEFGENLLDFTRNIDATEIATAIIPLGAKLEDSQFTSIDERLTIKSVNNGADYVYSADAVNAYGWIFKTVVFDGVNTASILKQRGEQYLADIQFEQMTIEAKAIDLHIIDGDIEQFKLGDMIRVKSAPHGLDRFFPLTKMVINLDSPSKNTVSLGQTFKASLTAKTSAESSEIKKKIENVSSTSSILQQAKDQASQMITAATHGFVVTTPNEQLIMDTDDVNTAQRIWRWNLNGLGYSSSGYNGTYSPALTADGWILGSRIAAGSIHAEQLDIAYRTHVEELISDAQSNAETNAADSVDGKLEGYYTKTQVDTTLKSTSDSIKLEVTKQAETYVGDQLKNYYSKSEVDVGLEGIKLEVSKTYATQDSLGNYTQNSEIRSRFAMDYSNVTIDSGVITFNSNTIVINSDNFQLTANGQVSARGKFTSEQARKDAYVLYAILEGRGLFNYSRRKDEAEEDAKVCIAINTIAGEKSGWLGVYHDGNISTTILGGAGRGVRVYTTNDLGNSVCAAYMNHSNNNRGYIGINNEAGKGRVTIGQNDSGGNIYLYNGTNNNATVSMGCDIYGGSRIDFRNANGTSVIAMGCGDNGTTPQIWINNTLFAGVNSESKVTVNCETLWVNGSITSDLHLDRWLYPTTIQMPHDFSSAIYMNKSKFCPAKGQNALYTDWVLVKGADGNNYWALCGFDYYRGQV